MRLRYGKARLSMKKETLNLGDQKKMETIMSKRNKVMEMDREIKELESRKRELECSVTSLGKKCEVVECSLMKLQVEMKEYQNLCEGVKELEVWKNQLQSKVRNLEEYAEDKFKALQAQNELLNRRDKVLELREKEFEVRAKEYENKKEFQYLAQSKQLDQRDRKLEKSVKEFQERVMAFENCKKSKEFQYLAQSEHLDKRDREFEQSMKEFEERVKASENSMKSKEFQSLARSDQLDQRDRKLEQSVRELEERVKAFENSMKSKEFQYLAQSEHLDKRDRELKQSVEEFEERVKAFEIGEKSKEVQYMAQSELLDRDRKEFDERVKALEIREKSKEVQYLDQSALLDRRERDFEDRVKSFEILQLKEKRVENDSLKSSGTIVLLVVLDGEDVHMVIDGHKINLTHRDEVSEALRLSAVPVFLVLEAMEVLYPPYLMNVDMRFEGNASRSCIILLEELVSICPKIKSEDRAHALKLALYWKDILSVGNSLEVLAFLYLLALFDLAPSFDAKEVMKLFQTVAEHWKKPTLCHHLGLKDMMPGFVEELIGKKQQLLAIEYVYEFDLVPNFPPVDLLKQHVLDLKSAEKTAESKDLAISEEISGLKKVMECISIHELEEQYSPDGIMERIADLEAERKSMTTSSRKRTGGLANTDLAPPSKKQDSCEGHS